MLTHRDGDLLVLADAGEFDVIVHGCNCMGAMGDGIARAIKKRWPAAYAADQATPAGDKAKLGTCSEATVTTTAGTLTVVNAYTQFDFRGHRVNLDLTALESCLGWLARAHHGRRIGMPRIGAGLAGGDWATILPVIERILADETATVVTLPPRAKR